MRRSVPKRPILTVYVVSRDRPIQPPPPKMLPPKIPPKRPPQDTDDWVRAAKDTYDELHDVWLDLKRK